MYLKVTYWRSIRFHPHGKCTYVMHTKPLNSVTMNTQFFLKQPCSLETGIWQLKGNIVSICVTLHNNYYLEMEFRLSYSKGRLGGWNELHMISHTTRKVTSEDRCDHMSKDERIFVFRRYKGLSRI